MPQKTNLNISPYYDDFNIDKNFDIWSGACENDYLGNVLDSWNIQTDTVCKQKTCTGCTDDLMTKKQQK